MNELQASIAAALPINKHVSILSAQAILDMIDRVKDREHRMDEDVEALVDVVAVFNDAVKNQLVTIPAGDTNLFLECRAIVAGILTNRNRMALGQGCFRAKVFGEPHLDFLKRYVHKIQYALLLLEEKQLQGISLL